ncbi:MAG: metallophosphoesterase [Candidatus Omnitrophota bacterium]
MVSVFLGIAVLLLVYKAFTFKLQLPRHKKQTLLLLLLAGLLFLLIPDVITGEAPVFVRYPGTWVGVLGIMVTFYITVTGISILFPGHRANIVFGGLGLFIVLSAYAVFNGLGLPRVNDVKIPMPKLPQTLSGFTIVHLSDLHLGSIATPEWMEQTVRKVNRLHPDLIVITGDLVEGLKPVEDWAPFIPLLKGLKAKYGTMAVPGNHDLVRGWRNFSKFASQSNLRILTNEAVTVAGGIQLVGINDPRGVSCPIGGPDLSKAFKTVNPSLPVILLSHRPNYFNMAQSYGVDLQLSGHTHAGQIPPLNLVIPFVYSYANGLYHRGKAYIYTSPGSSVMGVPMRVFSGNEIVRVQLVR